MICRGGVGEGGRGYSNRGIWSKDLNCPSYWASKLWRLLFLSFFPFFILIVCLLVPCMLETLHENWIRPCELPWQLKTSAICSSFEERKFKLICLEFLSSWSVQSLTFLHFIHVYQRLSKNKQQPRTVWCLILYFCIQTVHTCFRSRNTKTCSFRIMLFLAWWKSGQNNFFGAKSLSFH